MTGGPKWLAGGPSSGMTGGPSSGMLVVQMLVCWWSKQRFAGGPSSGLLVVLAVVCWWSKSRYVWWSKQSEWLVVLNPKRLMRQFFPLMPMLSYTARRGLFEDNGVDTLQILDRIPEIDTHPWLIPVGQAYHVRLNQSIEDERIMT